MAIVSALILLFSLHAFADEDFTGRKLPKIEAGVAMGLFYVPDYPGANEAQTRVIPVPYFVYRGEFFRSDRENGMRGRFLNNETVEFDVSFGAGFPVSGGENKAREGMPGLDWIGEIGPRLQVHLHRHPLVRIDLSLPARVVFTIADWEPRQRGYVFDPRLKFRHRALFDPSMSFFASAGATFADEEAMDYFYEVKPQYETANRKVFDAQAGFMSTNMSFSLVKAFIKQNVFIFAGIAGDYYAGADNRRSPLIKDNSNESYFLGVAWGFYKSDELEFSNP